MSERSEVWRRWCDDAIYDVRFALRQMRRSTTFALATIFCLALGIAASTAIFSVVNGLLLRPLPYRDADRLIVLLTDDIKQQLHETPVPFPKVPARRMHRRRNNNGRSSACKKTMRE